MGTFRRAAGGRSSDEKVVAAVAECELLAKCDAVTATGSAADNCKKNLIILSGCSAVGSAPGLGACDLLGVQPRTKTPKNLVFIDFFAHSQKQKSLTKRGLTTDLTTYRI